MRTPFDTDAPADTFTLTRQQLALVRWQTDRRAAMFRAIGDDAQADRVQAATFDLTSVEDVDALVLRMIAANKEMRLVHGFTLAYVDELIGRRDAELVEGIYRFEDQTYKVQRSKGSGRLYAKVFRTFDADEAAAYAESHAKPRAGAFEYATGAMRRLRPEHKLTLEQAKAYGRELVFCVVCGANLENEVSRAAGIGPVCGGRV